MAGDTPEPLEDFETWLLRRVAQAVESGEVHADLLTELRPEFEAARTRPQEESYVAAVQQVADIAGVAEDEARSTLEAIEAQPTLARKLMLRRFVEAWLEGQRKTYRRAD